MTTKPTPKAATSRRAGVLSPGTLVLGEYIIEQLVEQGSTRTMYRARHARRPGERFHVATLNDVTIDRLELIEAFARQSILLQSLRHPGIASVVAAGVDSGQVLMVSAEVKGKTLSDRLAAQKGGLPDAETVRIVRELAEVLDYLHGRDPPIVHRVLEPKGVLLAATDGAAILKDVGYAHALQVVQVASVEDVVPNAPAPYAAPECDSGRFAGPQADRYSLAAVAYECVHGKPHASGGADEETTQQGAQPSVFAIFERALNENPAKRFDSARAFAEELAEALVPLKPAGALGAVGAVGTAGAVGAVGGMGAAGSHVDRTEPIDPREQRRIAAVAGMRKKTMIGIAPMPEARPANSKDVATLDMPAPPSFESGRSPAAPPAPPYHEVEADLQEFSSPSIQVEVPVKLEPALPQVGRGPEAPSRSPSGSRHAGASGGYPASGGGYPAQGQDPGWGGGAMHPSMGAPEMLPLMRDPLLRAAVIAAAIISGAIVLAAIIMALVISSAIASARLRAAPGTSPTAASVMATSTAPTATWTSAASPPGTSTGSPTSDTSPTSVPTATATSRKHHR